MPRILVFTGDGKGKTTAALGLALRALGHGMPVNILQFLKCDTDIGEWAMLSSLGNVEIYQCGAGFVPRPDSPTFAHHQAAAHEGLERLRKIVADPAWHVCIFDELCGAVSLGLLDIQEVLEALQLATPDKILVLTGRGAPQELLDAADTVTEMRCQKHAYDCGIRAQAGVEF